MSSFKADLTVENQTYALKFCALNFRQNVGANGLPTTKTIGGFISFVLENPASTEILQWMMSPDAKKDGTISFSEVNSSSGTYQQVKFSNGYCVKLGTVFNGGKHAAGSLLSDFTISATAISVENVKFEK